MPQPDLSLELAIIDALLGGKRSLEIVCREGAWYSYPCNIQVYFGNRHDSFEALVLWLQDPQTRKNNNLQPLEMPDVH